MSEFYIENGELHHHGVKGMKWGVRRYQNKSGGLTEAGKRRYVTVAEAKLKAEKHANDARREAYKTLNASPKKHTQFEYDATAEKAARAARKKSIIEQKESIRQNKARHKVEKALEQLGGKPVSGLRKRQISVIEGKLRAEKHANDARREAYKILNESPKRHSKFQYDAAATQAARAARKNSIISDKETNKQIRAQRQLEKALKQTGSKRVNNL